ncbi:hypothetical protein THRCLA_10707 [Thraustotheca clavata]|uniref:Uncharacterized protein n=1 Tax=Thraustotheca clavata TaxID=74557 RepID=A0A1V9YI17_9STRA|nr:hypothetical protein THRCLA_10707 [Thraustotheca clavata]
MDTIQFPSQANNATHWIHIASNDSVDGLILHISGRVYISMEFGNNSNASSSGQSNMFNMYKRRHREGLSVLIIDPVQNVSENMSSLVHIVLHKSSALRYLSTIAETVLVMPSNGSLLPENTSGHSGIHLIARQSGSIYVSQRRPMTLGSLRLENLGSGIVQFQTPRLRVRTILEAKALGPGIVALQAHKLQTETLHTIAASDGDVYIASKGLKSSFMLSTMDGTGSINYYNKGEIYKLSYYLTWLGKCGDHDVSMLSSGTIHAGAIKCDRTFVYSLGPGNIIVDGGVILQTSEVGTKSSHYKPLTITHIGFTSSHSKSYRASTWQFRSPPPYSPISLQALAVPVS